MSCWHPLEERHHVYEGRTSPLADRSLCSLCGELLYEPPPDAKRSSGRQPLLLREHAREVAREHLSHREP